MSNTNMQIRAAHAESDTVENDHASYQYDYSDDSEDEGIVISDDYSHNDMQDAYIEWVSSDEAIYEQYQAMGA